MDNYSAPPRTSSDADVFSRGAIQLTFNLLRHKQPQLALCVRNILGQEPLPKDEEQTNGKHSDLFVVDLDSFQVRAIVEVLAEIQKSPSNIVAMADTGATIVAKTLLNDWIALADLMISRLPDEV